MQPFPARWEKWKPMFLLFYLPGYPTRVRMVVMAFRPWQTEWP